MNVSPPLLIAVSAGYLLLLFSVAWYGDLRARQGRSLIGNAWVYALSMAVYCTAWTYFGSVGRAASGGIWFLPIYLGPTLAMLLGWLLLRKMIRIARKYRITSIADFVASRYGKSRRLAGLVTIITVVGIVPYIALQLKAVATGYAVLTGVDNGATPAWWQDSALYVALVLAGFTMIFGTRHLDSTERHEGMVAAIAFESLVKLLAFLAVGIFVTWGLFDGAADLFGRAMADPQLASLLRLEQGQPFAAAQWFSLTVLAMLSVLFLPRQFQVIVIENVDERHLRRAVWVFPLYLLLINLFVLPIALGGLLLGGTVGEAESFVLSIPLEQGYRMLAVFAFIGGLSAATGMVIVEAIAVSTMVCNDLVMPLLLRTRRFGGRASGDLSRWLLGIRRAAIVLILLLGYAYFRIAGDAYALVSIGLISFAAVAQFAPVVLGGMYWKGGTRAGALAGLSVGFALWSYTLMLPSIAKSGWIDSGFVEHGPWGIALLRPEQLLGLGGLDNLTHALFWSLLLNIGAYVWVSLWRPPSAREISQALLFVDIHAREGGAPAPVFWRGKASTASLQGLLARFLGSQRAERLMLDYALRHALPAGITAADRPALLVGLPADAALVQFVETQLAGAIGSASARVMVASVVDEDALDLEDVMRILDEASELRATSTELRAANEQLRSLDRLKDDFMSSVTHELRTPLTSIRAFAELMVDDPAMDAAQRQQFLVLIVAETERLTRLVNQVLDLAKIESGNAEWHNSEVDLRVLLEQAAQTTAELFRERGAALSLDAPAGLAPVWLDRDRLLQVLMNLLSNAAKFMPAHGGRVELRLRATAEAALVEVEDNGAGVPAQEQALIFERFRQGDSGVRQAQGTGLGLPISRQIIEHFGGELSVHTGRLGGACFRFSLPWQSSGSGPGHDNGERT